MKKIAAICLGVSLLAGAVPMFADDAKDTTATKKAKKTGTKKTKAKKTTEEKK
jgi:uncharacterized membrane protein